VKEDYWYYDPVSDGFYYEHNGSRGWRKRNPKLHGTPGSVMQQQQAMKAAAAAEAEQQQQQAAAAAAAVQAQQAQQSKQQQQPALALASVMAGPNPPPQPSSLGSVAGKFGAGAQAGVAPAVGGVPNIK